MGNGTVIGLGKPGDIVMMVVVNQVAVLSAAESALVQAANTAWFNQPTTIALPMWPDGIIKVEAKVLEKANAKPMQVLFAEYKGGNDFEIITRLNNPPMPVMRDTYTAVMTRQNLPAESDQFTPEEDKKLSLGLGLFNLFSIPDFLPNLHPLIWLAIAMGAGYGTYKRKPIYEKAAFGAVAWIAAAKFVKTNTLKIKL
jgi:hypothetical protein